MKNIRITLNAQVATWARAQAAAQGVSLSRFVGAILQERMRRSKEYKEAYIAFLAEKPLPLKGPWKPYPKREELYDRPVLRRR